MSALPILTPAEVRSQLGKESPDQPVCEVSLFVSLLEETPDELEGEARRDAEWDALLIGSRRTVVSVGGRRMSVRYLAETDGTDLTILQVADHEGNEITEELDDQELAEIEAAIRDFTQIEAREDFDAD